MTVRWNKDEVKSSNAKSKEDSYLVWTKNNMAKGEKIKINVKYNKSAFGYLSKYKQNKNIVTYSNSYTSITFLVVMIVVLSIVISWLGGGYYAHRGFYGGYYDGYYDDGCVRSSCACAGSGRAGCSKKDFYGTKINKDKLKKALDR